jgi:hypothetical protein
MLLKKHVSWLKAVVFIGVLCLANTLHAQNKIRVVTDFDQNWHFNLGDVTNGEKPELNHSNWRLTYHTIGALKASLIKITRQPRQAAGCPAA